MRAVGSMALFGLPVLLLAFAIRQQSDAVIALDEQAIRVANRFARDSNLVSALTALQEISQPVVVYVAATPVVAWAWFVARLRGRALWAFTTMMASWGAGAVSKIIVQRARPALDLPLSHPQGYSFPSGHALNITAASSALLFLLWPVLSPALRRIAVGVAVGLILVVCADRILIGAHFPSDVVGGALLGLGITVSSWIGFVGPTSVTSSPEPFSPASASGP